MYSPQIRKNYQLKSGEGLSLLFLYTWVVGDVCNVLGAVIGHLLPTVIILGVYVSMPKDLVDADLPTLASSTLSVTLP